jgi:hypothetical protein
VSASRNTVFYGSFFDKVVAQALIEEWASNEHFSVDGTLIQSYASHKSLRPIASGDTRVSDGSEDDDPGNPTVNFRGERRSNVTHRSITDPEARLARKANGQASRLAHGMHILMENRNGLIMCLSTSEANGRAERQEALRMIRRMRSRHRVTPSTLAVRHRLRRRAIPARAGGGGWNRSADPKQGEAAFAIGA